VTGGGITQANPALLAVKESRSRLLSAGCNRRPRPCGPCFRKPETRIARGTDPLRIVTGRASGPFALAEGGDLVSLLAIPVLIDILSGLFCHYGVQSVRILFRKPFPFFISTQAHDGCYLLLVQGKPLVPMLLRGESLMQGGLCLATGVCGDGV